MHEVPGPVRQLRSAAAPRIHSYVPAINGFDKLLSIPRADIPVRALVSATAFRSRDKGKIEGCGQECPRPILDTMNEIHGIQTD